jgi:enamine deaminase RidA (YjgF/YER057c/UK114 family)
LKRDSIHKNVTSPSRSREKPVTIGRHTPQLKETAMSRIEARLAELGITLPAPNAPVANYIPYTEINGLVHISGQVSLDAHGGIKGKVGGDLTLEQGQAAARLCGLSLLAQLKAACGGNLDRLTRVVKLGGFVNAAPGFIAIPAVINGCSDLMVEVLGDAGRHARSAVGVF